MDHKRNSGRGETLLWNGSQRGDRAEFEAADGEREARFMVEEFSEFRR